MSLDNRLILKNKCPSSIPSYVGIVFHIYSFNTIDSMLSMLSAVLFEVSGLDDFSLLLELTLLAILTELQSEYCRAFPLPAISLSNCIGSDKTRFVTCPILSEAMHSVPFDSGIAAAACRIIC